jgi:hypothetical protein
MIKTSIARWLRALANRIERKVPVTISVRVTRCESLEPHLERIVRESLKSAFNHLDGQSVK